MRPIQDGNNWILYNDTGISLIDVGYPRAINVGISECTMLGMACGLASEGHKVFCYAITPHWLRAMEFIRTLLVPGKYNVVLCGFGEGQDYSSLGHSHQMDYSEMVHYCMGAKIPYYTPNTKKEIDEDMRLDGPSFIHIRKGIL